MIGGVADFVAVVGAGWRAGVFRHPLTRLVRAAAALRRYGMSPVGLTAANAVLYGDRPFVVDEMGTVGFAEFHRRTDALARVLLARGLTERDRVGVLCRNHRYFLEVMIACAKIGVDTVLLNTDFAGPRTLKVTAMQQLASVVADAEFLDGIPEWGGDPSMFVEAWPGDHLEPLIQAEIGRSVPPQCRRADHVILTSGTTGEPVALPRVALERQPGTVAAIAERVGLRAGDPFLIAAPLFHAWGFGNMTLAWLTGATVVLRRRFDPTDALATIAEHRVRSVAVVPVMAQRLLELPVDTRQGYDLTALRTVQSAGAPFMPGFARRFQDAFGDVLVNVYGSTEVGGIAYAVAADLRAEPATAGYPLRGTEVTVLDGEGIRLPVGSTGHVHVRRRWRLYGRNLGGERVSTGDVGRLDSAGRLFITGRADEMIVSGGENLYPGEVEKLIASHPDVLEAAVTGVPDSEFGTRLAAWVVRRPDSTLTSAQIRDYVRNNSARYHVPRDVNFVMVLPRNAAGKVAKRRLADNQSTMD